MSDTRRRVALGLAVCLTALASPVDGRPEPAGQLIPALSIVRAAPDPSAGAVELAASRQADHDAQVAAWLAAVEAQRLADEERARQDALDAQRRRQAADAAARAQRGARRTVATGGDVFAALAACESTGDRDGVAPHRIDVGAISPTGKYRGAFQFSLATWRSVGGEGDPAAASWETQLALARKLQARSGWGQWPDCSRRLGLR